MSDGVRPYWRLVRARGVGAFAVQGLWEASDHVLMVTNYMIREDYRRFFFQEIQATVWHRTRRSGNLAWIMTAMMALAAVPMLVWPNIPVLTIFGICQCCLLAAQVYNVLSGPTCRFYVQTATGLTHVACVDRMRFARRVESRVMAAASALQGEMPVAPPPVADVEPAATPDLQPSDLPPPESVPATFGVQPPVPVAVPAAAPAAIPPPLPLLPRPDLRLHFVAFGLLLALACADFAIAWISTTPLVVAGMVFSTLTFAVVLCGLIWSYRIPNRGALSACYWWAVVFFVTGGIAGYVGMMASLIATPPTPGTTVEWHFAKSLADLGRTSPWMFMVNVAAAAIELMVGAFGMGTVRRIWLSTRLMPAADASA